MFYVVIVLCLLVIYVYRNLERKQKIPQGLKEIPAVKGLPILGIVNKIKGPLCNYLVELSKELGPIYSIRIGMRDIVVLNTYEYVKAALVDNGEALSGRWKAFKYIFVTNNSGLLFTNGKVWAHQRSFVLRTLRNFGIGRSRSVEIVQDECRCMLEELDCLEDKSINFADFMPIHTANVIMKFVMNKRFTHGDPEFKVIEKYLKITGNNTDHVSNLCLMFPFLENNECLMKFIIWVSSRKSLLDDCHNLFLREIKNHRDNVDIHSDGDNLMDRFLIKQHQMKENNGNVESFTDWQLVRNGLDLLGAGYDTTSSLLTWSFMFMGMYPEVQNKVYMEILNKIGNERLPTMSDKVSLEYTQAVMDEIMRLSSVGPLALIHNTLCDITFQGYFIPKDTLVIPNLFACHLDRNVWAKPFEFYPEHFLLISENGVYKYKSREELIPFSMGKRQCLAESLARLEFFIFYSSVVQRYEVSLVERKGSFDVFSANDGIVRTPILENFIFKKREEFH